MGKPHDRLISKKVMGFYDWKCALITEDKSEGLHVNRSKGQLKELYAMYVKFQKSPEVERRRKQLYCKLITQR